MNKEALKLALEALEGFIPYLPLKDEAQCNRYDKAIIAIKEALAQPQPQRKPLTDEQIDAIADEYLVDYRIPAGCAWNFARDIEAAHGIKE